MRKISIIFLILICLFSCRTVRVEGPTKTELKETYSNSKDSIYIHDSIFVYTKGDTIFKTNTKYIYEYFYKTDTLKICDTLTKPIYLDKIIEKEVRYTPTYMKVLSIIGIISLILIGFFLYRKIRF